VLYKYAAFLRQCERRPGLIGAGPVQIPAFVCPSASPSTRFTRCPTSSTSRVAPPTAADPAAMGLYIVSSQLIAGPIIRYHYIAGQLVQRVVTREGFAQASSGS